MDLDYYKDLKELKWSLTEFVDDEPDFKPENEWDDDVYYVSIKKGMYEAVFGKTPTFARIDPFQEYFERCACLRDAMPITVYEGKTRELKLCVQYETVMGERFEDNLNDLESSHSRYKRTQTRVMYSYRDGFYLQFPHMYAELHDPDGTRRKFVRMAILMMYAFDDKKHVYNRSATRLSALEIVYQMILDDVRPPAGKPATYELIKSLMDYMSDDIYVQLLYASHNNNEISEMKSKVKNWNNTRQSAGNGWKEHRSGLVPRVKTEGNWSVIGEAFLLAASKLRRFDYVGPTPIPPTYGDAKFMANVGESEPSYVFYGETLQRFVYRSNGSFASVGHLIDPNKLSENRNVLIMYKENLKLFEDAILLVAELFHNIRTPVYVVKDLSRAYIARDDYNAMMLDIMEIGYSPMREAKSVVVKNAIELNMQWWNKLVDAIILMQAVNSTYDMQSAISSCLNSLEAYVSMQEKKETQEKIKLQLQIGEEAYKASILFISRLANDFRNILDEFRSVELANSDASKSFIDGPSSD